MMIRQLMPRPFRWSLRSEYCALWRHAFLIAAFLCLCGQVLYDHHLETVVSIFPQWLLLGSIWYAWRPAVGPGDGSMRGTLVFALLIPALTCLTLLVAWHGWKANVMALCGVIPISDAGSNYISAQTLLRDAFLDPSGQRRPLNTALTSLWLFLSGDDLKLMLLLQALAFSVAAFLASTAVAAVHGFRGGLLMFALLLVFAEPYLPTVLSETNGMIFGVLSLVGFLFGTYRKSFLAFFCGVLFLAIALAIRPSALFVLPCMIAAGAMIFAASGIKRLAVIASLITVILLPTAISVQLDRSMSHGGGALNSNLSYTIYGLVVGGKGWEQYQKDNPRTLDGLPETGRSHVVMQASWQYFKQHPFDLPLGLIKGQAVGPVQTFAQMARLVFLGAAGDPLRIIPPAVIIVMSVLFAGVLACQAVSGRRVFPASGNLRLFGMLFLGGYLTSIPFFYQDGGLRLHAAVLPVLSYMLVWVLLPPGAPNENTLSNSYADLPLIGTIGFGFVLLGLSVWISTAHPKSHKFDLIPGPAGVASNKTTFRFEPGWPQCDLRKFDRPRGDNRPRWFSGAIPDDNYRSEGIKEISGQGHLYFGFDAGARGWKIIHSDRPVGRLNQIEIGPGSPDGTHDDKYRDFWSAETVLPIGERP
jgi:hypothetical protein